MCRAALCLVEAQAQLDARAALLSGLEQQQAAVEQAAAAAAKSRADIGVREAQLVSVLCSF